MKMVLIRHAQTVGNREKRYLGVTESPLTAAGQKTEKTAADKIAPYCGHGRTALFTSPSGRAKSMAAVIEEKYGCTPAADTRLAEMNFGVFDGLTAKECEAAHPDSWQAWMADFMHFRLPEGESNIDVQRRVASFLADLKGKPIDTAVIVTHGGIIRAMLTQLLDIPAEAAWHFDIDLAGIAVVEVIDGYGILKALNI